jgi:hypothetical protein
MLHGGQRAELSRDYESAPSHLPSRTAKGEPDASKPVQGEYYP